MKTSKPSKASAAIWDRAHKLNAARSGFPDTDPADAFVALPIPISKLIATINTDPKSLPRLAARSGELTEAQRVQFLTKYKPLETSAAKNPKKPKAKAAAPRPPLLRRHDLTFGRTGFR